MFVFLTMLIIFPTVDFNISQKVINGIGSPDDRHGTSPILLHTVTLFVYIDQLFCYCVFIYSNLH